MPSVGAAVIWCLFTYTHRWFENVTLANRACGGGIVAWKGTNLTDAPGNRYGAYIDKSKIIRVRKFNPIIFFVLAEVTKR